MATIKDLKKMCRSFKKACNNCPLYSDYSRGCCGACQITLPDNADEIVDKWVEEHPVKTYMQDFFEKFPNAMKAKSGEPIPCVKSMYPKIHLSPCLEEKECFDCWNQEMKEE